VTKIAEVPSGIATPAGTSPCTYVSPTLPLPGAPPGRSFAQNIGECISIPDHDAVTIAARIRLPVSNPTHAKAVTPNSDPIMHDANTSSEAAASNLHGAKMLLEPAAPNCYALPRLAPNRVEPPLGATRFTSVSGTASVACALDAPADVSSSPTVPEPLPVTDPPFPLMPNRTEHPVVSTRFSSDHTTGSADLAAACVPFSSLEIHLPLAPAKPFAPSPILLPMPKPLFDLPPCTEPPVVGPRISHPGFHFNLRAMQELGFPRDVLQQLADGVRMRFVSAPDPYFRGNHGSASRTPEDSQIVHDDLRRLYDLGKLSDLGDVPPTVCNPLGLVLKRDKVRVVLDASISGVNDCMDLIYYGLPTVRDVVRVLTPGCYVAKLDASDAYLCIPTAPDEARYFGIQDPVTGRFFQYDYCPFGGRNSGPLFCLVMEQVIEAVKREWKRHGIDARIGSFSDDAWIVAQTFAACSAALAVACHVFQLVGMYVKPSKVIPGSQLQDVIGVLFDTVQGIITITEDRKLQLIQGIDSLLGSEPAFVETLETLVGRLGFVQCAVSGLSPDMQHLYPLLPEYKVCANRNRFRRTGDRVLALDQASREALCSIRSRIVSSPSRRMHVDENGYYYLWDRHTATSGRAQVEVDLDASGNYGWGIRWIGGDEARAGRWSNGWSGQHINCKETYCTLIALRWWGALWSRRGFSRILVYCDNTVAVACLNKLRSPSHALGRLCTEVNRLCEQHSLELVAVHKPGWLNVVPDGLSRGSIAPWSGDFRLNQRGVSELCRYLRVRGRVLNCDLLDFTDGAPVGHSAHRGAAVLGFVPHQAAIQVLKGLLVARRQITGFRVAVCMPVHSYTFIAGVWGTFRRYFVMHGLWRKGHRGVLDQPCLDTEFDDGSRVTLSENPWRVVVLEFRNGAVGSRFLHAGRGSACM